MAGEAAGIAIGLVLFGSGYSSTNPMSSDTPASDSLSELVQELKHYSRDTQHEKIIHGISLLHDKHQSTLTKMGAILVTGILDAGDATICWTLVSEMGLLK